MVGFGRSLPPGHLPVFSVDTEKEAKRLIVATCQMAAPGVYIARELAEEQTLDNLQAFSDRLQQAHDAFVEAGRCECTNAAV